MARVLCLALALAAFQPQSSYAQDAGLSRVLVDLVGNSVLLADLSANAPPGSISHVKHFFEASDEQLRAPILFNQAIVSQLSTYPVGSSSGGFTYNFDPGLGTYTRSSNTFGPSFAERAIMPKVFGRHSLGAEALFEPGTHAAAVELAEASDGRNGFAFLLHDKAGDALVDDCGRWLTFGTRAFVHTRRGSVSLGARSSNPYRKLPASW